MKSATLFVVAALAACGGSGANQHADSNCTSSGPPTNAPCCDAQVGGVCCTRTGNKAADVYGSDCCAGAGADVNQQICCASSSEPPNYFDCTASCHSDSDCKAFANQSGRSNVSCAPVIANPDGTPFACTADDGQLFDGCSGITVYCASGSGDCWKSASPALELCTWSCNLDSDCFPNGCCDTSGTTCANFGSCVVGVDGGIPATGMCLPCGSSVW